MNDRDNYIIKGIIILFGSQKGNRKIILTEIHLYILRKLIHKQENLTNPKFY